MKKYLKPILMLTLVVALLIGGTLAYLTDTTEELENKFTIDEKVDIDLQETHKDFELTPGKEQPKDPTVTVLKNSSYVFTEVVEKLPTAALANGDYNFADYVTYSVNTAGGAIFSYDEDAKKLDESTTAWKWKLVQIDGADFVTGKGNYDGKADGGDDEYTTVTRVYALVGADDELLPVSSLDKDGTDKSKDASYPVLTDSKVTIPTDLTQEMLDLFIIPDTDPAATYSADLNFTGYAIQSEGLETGLDMEDIFNAAKGITE